MHTNTDISYDRLDALTDRGKQIRSEAVRTAFARISLKRLLARLEGRLPERRSVPSDPAGPEPA